MSETFAAIALLKAARILSPSDTRQLRVRVTVLDTYGVRKRNCFAVMSHCSPGSESLVSCTTLLFNEPQIRLSWES